ncbi:MAG TPA: TIR domain-containing protein [Micromonosporaceae bacterium]|nr:TIR domain-containing protein [Micromonosporaceae bacterium]
MQHVFISYSHHDRDWVAGLVAEMRNNHVQPWIDAQDIPPTVEWKLKVVEEIEAAAAVMACRSDSFEASVECQFEINHARGFGTRVLDASVGEDPSAAVDRLLGTLVVEGDDGQVTLSDSRRADRMELRRIARDWAREGRPRRALVGRRRRRAMKHSLRFKPSAQPYEDDFLRASLSRSRQRAVLVMAAVFVVVAGFGAYAWYSALNLAVAQANAQQAATYLDERARLNAIAEDPYRGLSIAAGLGDNESASDANVISLALRDRTPDDAFTIDSAAGGLRLGQRPITTDVVVVDIAGHTWSRPTAATDARAATRRPGRPASTGEADPWPADLTVSPLEHAGTVSVLRSGRLWRTVHFGAPPTAIQISPDGRLLAAAAGSGIQIADLGTGMVRLGLRGAPGAVGDIAWSADAVRIWGLGSRWAVAWRVSDATTLLNRPSESYTALLPSPDPRRWWVAGRHELTQIDVRDGRPTATRSVPDDLVLGAGAPDGSVAAVVGRRLWIVPLIENRPARAVDVPGCTFGRPVFVDTATLYLPCLDGDLLTIGVELAAVTGRLSVTTGLASVTPLRGTDAALAGDRFGHLFLVSDGTVKPFDTNGCGASAQRIAVSAGVRAVVAVGAGTGLGLCGRVGLRTGADPLRAADWTFNTLAEPDHASGVATAATFNLGGDAFATAYSNGAVILHPTGALTPAVAVAVAIGAVRDLAMTADGDLLIVTAEGMLQRVAFCDGCVNNAALARVAAARLDRALALGLAVRPGPTTPTGSPSTPNR